MLPFKNLLFRREILRRLQRTPKEMIQRLKTSLLFLSLRYAYQISISGLIILLAGRPGSSLAAPVT